MSTNALIPPPLQVSTETCPPGQHWQACKRSTQARAATGPTRTAASSSALTKQKPAKGSATKIGDNLPPSAAQTGRQDYRRGLRGHVRAAPRVPGRLGLYRQAGGEGTGKEARAGREYVAPVLRALCGSPGTEETGLHTPNDVLPGDHRQGEPRVREIGVGTVRRLLSASGSSGRPLAVVGSEPLPVLHVLLHVLHREGQADEPV